jgi:uracil-DNA glycosylase family 4
VKCLPPGNRPNAAEIRQCGRYLAAELRVLRGERPRRDRCVLCLGRLAHQAVAAALPEKLDGFRHGAIQAAGKHLYVADTYHPSRLNTNTGRLTEQMMDRVLQAVRDLLAG